MVNPSNKVLNNFTGGEISPRMYSRSDLPIYNKSAAKILNFISLIQGGARYRNGTMIVHQTKSNKIATLIPFQFSDQQSYLIEATNQNFRFYSNGGIIFGGGAVIQNISRSGIGIITSQNHGFIVGDRIHIDGVNGMSGLNGQDFLVNTVPNSKTFSIKTLAGVVVDTRTLGAYKDGGTATKVAPISGVSNANPGVFTSVAHGLTAGQEIVITGIVGMTGINGGFFLVSATGLGANTFTLTDLQGVPLDTTALGAYVSGGSVAFIYEIGSSTCPYLEADEPTLYWTQDANTMYITHQSYEPRKLVRTSAASFTLGTYARAGTDPFPPGNSDKWPRCCSFINGSRLSFGDTILNPETFWASDAPSTSNTAFDSFVVGTTATNSVIFTLTPQAGKTDAIQWISVTAQFGVVGCYGSVRSLYGGTPDQAISPQGVTSKPINFDGCSQAMPITTGESMFYVQRGSRILRSIQYDFSANGYTTTDLTLVAEHLTVSGLARIIFQKSIPDCVWALRGDGNIIGLTFKQKENIQGWHQHKIGGQSINANGILMPFAKVLSIGIMPRGQDSDQLWMVVERQVGDNTVRTVEYMTDEPEYPNEDDFFTGDKDGDQERYQNAMFETQKYANHLDGALLYDGSQNGVVTLTPSALTGDGITVTANIPFFTADMVGRQLWKQYDLNGNGGGRCEIVAYVDSTHVTCDVKVDFDNVNTWAIGAWLITAINISGLAYAEGQLMSVIADGGPHPDCLVTNGTITLDRQTSVAWVGFAYKGMVASLNLDSGGTTGTAEAKPRTVKNAALTFMNTVSCKIGTNLYDLQKLNLKDKRSLSGRPTMPFNGIHIINSFDGWSNRFNPKKRVFVYKDDPTPCTVTGLDLAMLTVDEGNG